MRKFAISDIHGAKKTFLALLDELQLSTDDELYLLGDYIDRGPDSKGVIDHIWELQEKGYKIACLRGNHEQMLLDVFNSPYPARSLGWNYPNTLDSFKVKGPREIDRKYLRWMEKLPYYFEVDQYIMTHAGLNYNVLDPLSDTKSMMWIRDSRGLINREWLRGRMVIHGHTPTNREEIEHHAAHLDDTPQLVIDGGCVFGTSPGLGHLIAFELETQELTFMKCLDYAV